MKKIWFGKGIQDDYYTLDLVNSQDFKRNQML